MTTMNGLMNDRMAAAYAAAILLLGYLAANEMVCTTTRHSS
jgi:hypothetical protein